MPEPDEINQDRAQTQTIDPNRTSASPDNREPNTQPSGADIVAALANSPLTGVNITRLTIRARVRSEALDADEEGLSF